MWRGCRGLQSSRIHAVEITQEFPIEGPAAGFYCDQRPSRTTTPLDMKPTQILRRVLIACSLLNGLVVEAQTPSDGWHATTVGGAVGLTVLFSLVGVLLAVVSYKLFDLFTPGHLHREIFENRNVAAAIIGAAVILGACIIIAAAILG